MVLRVLPSVDPDAEREDLVNPLFRVVVVVVFARDWFASRKAVGTLMFVSRNMNKLEVEEQNSSDPAVHHRVRLHVGVVEHSAHILGVHFYNQVSSSNNVYAKCAKSAEKSIKLNLGLRVATLALIPGNGSETRGPAPSIFTLLGKNPTYGAPRRVTARKTGRDDT